MATLFAAITQHLYAAAAAQIEMDLAALAMGTWPRNVAKPACPHHRSTHCAKPHARGVVIGKLQV